MKRFCYLLFFLLVLSCNREKIQPEPKPDDEKPEVFVPLERIEGRVALSYVTYYSQGIPDPTLLTHICYAFAELYVVNGQYREFRLQGDESRFAAIVDLKKNHPQLKILLAFTHTVVNKDNAQGGGFSSLSSTDEGRKAFASDCLKFIEQWGIDGIDIGWEFPGISWSGHASNPASDTQNHVLLMKQLRETLGPNYLLTFPGYVMDVRVSEKGSRYIDLKAVEPYVDFVNVMTYDMDQAPKHHSALEDSRAYWDCARTYQAYVTAGFPPEKMVLGIPFYGRISFSTSPSAITYRQIQNLDPSLYTINNWDPTASVPYVIKKSSGAFYCGYDNAQSIAVKGSWLHARKMKGMMCWMYNGDDEKGTLRKAMWNAVMRPL
ncbi:MAG TPA: glycosyl hydrolase family 18 protein [Bacteroidales bacterium]|nr:glycosyl hydrolase family 18 protein [Bacteroidales bacterium]HPW78811.1 glycosyl hydrolase family 18 protein [Bacteroidales bacterium]HQB56374.1 glycosyl hydrolase family 18 protein [Bacteroidales bacterium]